MQYLITGGAGFIASHIAEDLIARNHDVVLIDDMSAGSAKNIQPDAEFIKGSVTDRALLDKICKTHTFEGIFHLAAVASVQKSIEDPTLVHEVNATGTMNILNAAKEHTIRKVVLSTSAAAYGDNPVFPKREDMLPEPLSPYAVSKIAGEMYCRNFADLFGVETVALRYFNVFGPRQDPNAEYAAVIPKFTEKIVHGEKPIIFGDGNQTRDFVFVKDVVQANMLAMNSHTSGLFNIGTGIQTSLNDLAGMIMRAAGVTCEIIYQDPRPGDIRYSVADISKAKQELGYAPKYSIEDGIKETVAYFKDLL
ncbi:MAG: SDR family oxidoreductase [Methanocorpusculum sp.]|uniref:SDR family oxidoreductase n=1 Tax=Methanocorpusculum sp. TaxID=2058474 RepID=UPI0027179A33|nr:SDR family oxidoreductase [Methanocorpusculum sp.]MDO9523836.1 SDR family oxidoreductase [Methanocorpusculum sp.]